MHTIDPVTLDILGRLLDWRRETERKLYNGMMINAEMTCELFNTLVLAADHIAQLCEACAGQARTIAQMEAIARDLDPSRKVLAFCAGQKPSSTPPRQQQPAPVTGDVVEFLPRRLPPRPLYVPSGPGGAA